MSLPNLFQNQPKKVTISGNCSIEYEDSGNATGPTFLCVPGIGDFRQSFRFLVPELQKELRNARFLCMDVRGQGESSVFPSYKLDQVAEDFKAVLDDAKVDKVVIMGNSLAGSLMVGFAAKYPERVTHMVGLGAICRRQPSENMMYWISGLLFNRLWGASSWMGYYKTLFVQKPSDFDPYMKAMAKKCAEPGRVNAIKQLIIGDKNTMWKDHANVKAKALFVVGSKDPDFSDPKKETEFYASTFQGKAVCLDNVSHYPHVEKPVETCRGIVEFLK